MKVLLKENDEPFTFKDYLKWEAGNDEKHEYFGGAVFAVGGASDNHALVVGNIFAGLHHHLKGKGCRVYAADMKLKVSLKYADAGYYPDIMVVCDPDDTYSHFKTRPKVIVEVMSDFRRDQVEKFMVYQNVESLEDYVIISQEPDEPKAWIYRRETSWNQEIVKPGETLAIRSIEFSIPLDELYQG